MMSVNINFDYSRINGRMEEFKGKLCAGVKQQVKSGSDQYTPYHNGDLMDSADATAHTTDPILVYDCAYAKYQYYAGGGAPDKDFENRDRTTHPLATMQWVDEYLAAGGRSDVQYICDNAPELFNF